MHSVRRIEHGVRDSADFSLSRDALCSLRYAINYYYQIPVTSDQQPGASYYHLLPSKPILFNVHRRTIGCQNGIHFTQGRRQDAVGKKFSTL